MGIVLTAAKGNADPKKSSTHIFDDERQDIIRKTMCYIRPGTRPVKDNRDIGKVEIIDGYKWVFKTEEDHEFFLARKKFVDEFQQHETAFMRNKQEPITSRCTICQLIGYPRVQPGITVYRGHAISYNWERKIPNWTLQMMPKNVLETADVKSMRKAEVPEMYESGFFLKKFRTGMYDYDDKTHNVNRGHMISTKMFKYDKTAFEHSRYAENTVPQDKHNNAVFWNELEKYDLEVMNTYGKIWLLCGPLFLPKSEPSGDWKIEYEVLGGSRIAIPNFLFKMMITKGAKLTNVGAFAIPNRPINCKQTLLSFETTMEFLDNASGLYFLPNLDRRLCASLCPKCCRINDCGAQLAKHYWRVYRMRTDPSEYEKISNQIYNSGFKNAKAYLSTLYGLLNRKRFNKITFMECFEEFGPIEAEVEIIDENENVFPDGDYFVKHDTSVTFDSEKFCKNRIVDWENFVSLGEDSNVLFDLKDNDYSLPKQRVSTADKKDVKKTLFKKERVIKKPITTPTHQPMMMDFNCFGKFQKGSKVETEIKLAKSYRKPDIEAFRHGEKRQVRVDDDEPFVLEDSKENKGKIPFKDTKEDSAMLQVKENVAKMRSSTVDKDSTTPKTGALSGKVLGTKGSTILEDPTLQTPTSGAFTDKVAGTKSSTPKTGALSGKVLGTKGSTILKDPTLQTPTSGAFTEKVAGTKSSTIFKDSTTQKTGALSGKVLGTKDSTRLKDSTLQTPTSGAFTEKVDADAKTSKRKIQEAKKVESFETMKVTCKSPGIAAFQPIGSTYKDSKERIEVQVNCVKTNFEAFVNREK